MYGIDEEHLLEAFEIAMSIQDSADHLVVSLEPAKLRRSMAAAGTTDSFWTEDIRFNNLLATMRSVSGSGVSAGQSTLSSIKSAPSHAVSVDIASGHIIDKLGRMLMLDAEQFDLDFKSIADYGLDSMIGAEFRNWVFKELYSVPAAACSDFDYWKVLRAGLRVFGVRDET